MSTELKLSRILQYGSTLRPSTCRHQSQVVMHFLAQYTTTGGHSEQQLMEQASHSLPRIVTCGIKGKRNCYIKDSLAEIP